VGENAAAAAFISPFTTVRHVLELKT
jgi:hypothetical protein